MLTHFEEHVRGQLAGRARIRTQMSAALTDVDFAIGAIADAGKALGIIG